MSKTLSVSIERLEMMEEKFGVIFEGASAKYDAELLENDGDVYLEVFADVQSTNGTSINQDLRIVAAVYGESGKILAKEERALDKDSFYGIDSIDFCLNIHEAPSKVRIYPKAG